MTTASSPSRTAMVTVSLVRSLKRSQTGLAQRRMSGSALTALASRTSPKPSLYFSVAASCSTSPLSLNVVSSRYAVDLWISSSLETSVTPDHPRRDKNSITDMALSTDCTEGLLRTKAHISADPTLPSVSWLGPLGAWRPRALPPLPSLCVRWLATTPKDAAQAHSRVGEEGSWTRGWTQGSRSRWWLRCFSRPRLSLGSRPASRAIPPVTSPFYVSSW